MDQSLRDAVLGSANIQAPTSPLGSFPELAQLYQSAFQLPQSGGAAAGLANSAQAQVTAAKTKASKKDYQRIKKKDGGYAFFDPDGNEISAYDYANAVGKAPKDVLADSENPIDIGYQQDFDNLQDYIKNKLNSKFDDNASKSAQKIEQQVRDSYGVELGTMSPNDIIERFKQAYPTVYGRKNTGVPVGQSFIPRPMSPNQIDLTESGNRVGEP